MSLNFFVCHKLPVFVQVIFIKAQIHLVSDTHLCSDQIGTYLLELLFSIRN